MPSEVITRFSVDLNFTQSQVVVILFNLDKFSHGSITLNRVNTFAYFVFDISTVSNTGIHLNMIKIVKKQVITISEMQPDDK